MNIQAIEAAEVIDLRILWKAIWDNSPIRKFLSVDASPRTRAERRRTLSAWSVDKHALYQTASVAWNGPRKMVQEGKGEQKGVGKVQERKGE